MWVPVVEQFVILYTFFCCHIVLNERIYGVVCVYVYICKTENCQYMHCVWTISTVVSVLFLCQTVFIFEFHFFLFRNFKNLKRAQKNWVCVFVSDLKSHFFFKLNDWSIESEKKTNKKTQKRIFVNLLHLYVLIHV